MSKIEDLMAQIPFFKKHPISTAIILIMSAMLTFSILNLDKLLDFKLWLTNSDVTIIVKDSQVTPSKLFTTGFTHTITFQVFNSRNRPLVVEKVMVVDWDTKAYIPGYKYIPSENKPVKPGETRDFTISNYLLDYRPGLGENDKITQGLHIKTT